MLLTPRQKDIFIYIERYIKKNKAAPTYDEIRKRFGFSSFNAVFKHIKQLEEKGAITVQPNRARAITIVEEGTSTVNIKLLGTIAAGQPIEAVENDETISVPQELLGRGENFCLKVKGDSMVGDGIFDGDIVIINKRAVADNGEMVAALIDSEATLKRFYKREEGVELRPSNPLMEPIIVKFGEVTILGVVVGLLRKY
ncbi:MAG: transcriptional repressor LexA [Candidatus Scalindua sp. AMX11]|nr:MAG: transcriptional repressor LexA [Candidatus Scalindua sp.]NOG85933.1 transcriptional repressor LexA [Planctomycetota bacterium]RZV91434.1 MAG: transcriptional repressor LexA [Candidatus Scalindua sp. SCAELEC01]TDE65993.1 MAG: transcriptional repressor LexA [Candidatus Scalindua sp. AMX11]GJQ59303.1 MAG: LexA repressor [Candidatus Scalindua sp.]